MQKIYFLFLFFNLSEVSVNVWVWVAIFHGFYWMCKKKKICAREISLLRMRNKNY